MKKRYLEVGKVTGTHGIRGELRVQPWANGPDFLCGFDTLYFKNGEEPVAVESARPHKTMVLLKFKGIDGIEAAQTLRGRVLYIDRADVTLAPGEYFIQDLQGLQVQDVDTGEIYGELTDVSRTGANDVYHVKTKQGEVLIPAIPDVIVQTDIEGGIMKIRPIKGLFDDAN